jgi:hypothetical protein
LYSCHDLWEQADSLVHKGNHTGEFYFYEYRFFFMEKMVIFVKFLEWSGNGGKNDRNFLTIQLVLKVWKSIIDLPENWH